MFYSVFLSASVGAEVLCAVILVAALSPYLLDALKFLAERREKRLERYAEFRYSVFRELISAYSELYFLKGPEPQQNFLRAWRNALVISDGKLHEKLLELSFMRDTASIKPGEKQDAIFLECVLLFQEDFMRNTGKSRLLPVRRRESRSAEPPTGNSHGS